MTFAQETINQGLSAKDKVHLYREMMRIRKFEQACMRGFQQQRMGGWLLLTIGQEGTPVALRSIMEASDHTITGPRGMGAAVASGMSMESIMAELYGKRNGCSQGKGGMFSLFSSENHHWGCFPIAAAQTPLALGFAFAMKYQKKKGASFCFLGDES